MMKSNIEGKSIPETADAQIMSSSKHHPQLGDSKDLDNSKQSSKQELHRSEDFQQSNKENESKYVNLDAHPNQSSLSLPTDEPKRVISISDEDGNSTPRAGISITSENIPNQNGKFYDVVQSATDDGDQSLSSSTPVIMTESYFRTQSNQKPSFIKVIEPESMEKSNASSATSWLLFFAPCCYAEETQ